MEKRILKAGDLLHGFKVERIRENSEIRGRMVEMTFEKTATPLCWVDNGEENKLFSITFKTLPENSTGVFHILEHSTLCGSKKYPVREPFVELLKSSMNTFLNAMTFQDKTMYPVSSRVNKDYLNLAGVYMDAVFAPRLLEDPNIFYQEGHHTETDENGKLSYKGVVFNEMKGAMSGADRVMGEKMASLLCCDNSYGFNSGGDPEVIPDLTYEAFCETYRRFYHPSNAFVFLDGDIPLDETLILLEEYFSAFDRREDLPVVVPQQPKACEDSVEFEIGAEEDTENKGRLSFARLVGTYEDKEKLLAADILCDVLCGSNESPLKRAVLESGLAQDMSLGIDNEMYQPEIFMDLININDGCEQELISLIRGKLRELIRAGLDKKAIEAAINRNEFHAREPEEPQGLIRAIEALSGWLHGGDPLRFCTCDSDFKAVREMMETGAFDRLAEEIFLDEDGICVLHGIPSKTVGDEKREKEEKRLQEELDRMSEKDIEALKEANDRLVKWQQTPDSEESLATLPLLDLSDVNPEPFFTDSIEGEQAGVKTVFHPVSCHGIHHIALWFSLGDLDLAELAKVNFVCDLFASMPTGRLGILELEQEIKNSYGRISFKVQSISRLNDRTHTAPYLVVSFSVLDDKLESALALLHEIITDTRFDLTDRIRERVMQAEEMSKQAGAQAGHIYGLVAAASRYSADAAVREVLNGSTALNTLHAFAKDFDGHIGEMIEEAQKVMKQVFCRSRLTATVSGDTPCDLSSFLEKLPLGEKVPELAAYSISLPARLGLRTTAQISFAEQSWHLDEAGKQFDGSMLVASNIISLCCLWNKVRVQGGAYGCSMRASLRGSLDTYSYRDPSPARTLNVYKEAAAFLREMVSSGEKLDKYIISTVSNTDPLSSPRETGITADLRYFGRISREEERKQRKAMLETVPSDLLRFADILDQFAANGAVCVVGHDAALKECDLDEIRDL